MLITTPKGAGDFRLPFYYFLADLISIIAVERLIIAVIRLAIVISTSISSPPSFVFPFGNYILAYSDEYVKGLYKLNSKKNSKGISFEVPFLMQKARKI